MALESATYISGLNAANPVAGDAKTEGDDHLRLIKSTLLATFPNVTGAMTKTHTELNNVLSSSSWAFNSNRLVNTGNTQPAFLATGSATTNAGSEVELDDYAAEVYDYGSCFNPTTGRFTAPVAGLYLFTFCIYGTGIATSGYTAQLFKNGGSVAGAPVVYPEHGDSDVYATNTAQLVLSANDYVSVFANSGSVSKTLNCTSFFGRLLG